MTEEHKEKIFNYFWGQIAPKMGMRLSDYRLKVNRKAEYNALLPDNGRLRVNSYTYTHTYEVYNIPCPLSDINVRMYLQTGSISDRYFQLYYHEYGKRTLYYQLWERKY